jgi:hypothetical protein
VQAYESRRDDRVHGPSGVRLLDARPLLGSRRGGNFSSQVLFVPVATSIRSPFADGGACKREETNMRLLTLSLAAAVLIVAWLFSVPTANAQAQSPSPGLSEQSQTQDIPDQKLNAAAAALERVASLTQHYREQIAAAPPSDQERIAEEAKNAFVKAVTDQGLSIAEYASILKTAQNDPEIRGKILQRIRPSAK